MFENHIIDLNKLENFIKLYLKWLKGVFES